ncbi:MAG: L-serine ammonia-lyase, iron-sulfur-dependent, subunit alpha [Bacilli bacterium]
MLPSIKTLYKIGPGPSSSHTIGPYKAAKDFLETSLRSGAKILKFSVVLYGSLAFTGKGHATDMIIREVFRGFDIKIDFDTVTKKEHPNMMVFSAYDKFGKVIFSQDYNSVGGGDLLKGKSYLESRRDIYPFDNFRQMEQYLVKSKLSVRELILQFEGQDILRFLEKVLNQMMEVVNLGLKQKGEVAGELHVKRMANYTFNQAEELPREVLGKNHLYLASYAYAASECNCAGEKVVTCPTCGATGVLTGLMYYEKHNLNRSSDALLDGLAIAGLIGLIVRKNASISGAVAGCQAEIGTATSMAAGAMCLMDGLSIEQIEYAAEIGMEHSLGLTCDPVKGYVAIPCIERNVMGVFKAFDSYALAKNLSKFRKNTISFDEAVQAMYESGKAMHEDFKETSKGGLEKVHIC